ncbi:Small subunit (SSU) processome component [Malassezia nana]|uniref:Small subunit (SSU) processome component n=1 Tax=Malassezia nana TaxID=180528 RepID=A0AAF0EM79_9BASI|nr:Small subunit (SSU) processome component [Malassezia nana]
MARNKTPKPPKSRPVSTSSLSQPIASSFSAQITAFSSDASLFAQLSQAVDRARLRVYATGTPGVLADYLLPEGLACRAIAWVTLGTKSSTDRLYSKKRKALAKAEAQGASTSPTAAHVALGMSDGTVLLFSPHTASVVHVLVASTPDSASAAVAALTCDEHHVWGVTAHGWVHGWDLAHIAQAAAQDRVPPAVHFLPDSKTPISLLQSGRHGRMLMAHHAILLYDTPGSRAAASFSGHATPITHLAWVGTHAFVSAAAEDRHLYYWLCDAAQSHGQASAMLTLDAPARRLLTWEDKHGEWYLLTVSERGTAHVYSLPRTMPATQGLATLSQVSEVRLSTGSTELCDAMRCSDRLVLARAVKGVKIVLDEAALYDGDTLCSPIVVHTSASRKQEAISSETQRYKDQASAAGTRNELPSHTAAAAALLGSDGGLLPTAATSETDPHNDLLQSKEAADEPTLAQRLKALKVQQGEAVASDLDASLGAEGSAEAPVVPVGGASLASSLTQALHSGDQALLTSCLVHSDPALIRMTVRRISGPLAVRLLEACVDRLNRGGVKSKGALGSARARGIVEWIHQTLTCHTAYLMSLPNLVSRLSQLHHSLSARLASYERLLALKGRMELVMTQIDLHMTYTADDTSIQVQGQKLGKKSTQAELAKKQAATQQRQEGEVWVEPQDDDDDVEDIGLSAGADVTMDDEHVDGMDEDDLDAEEVDAEDLDEDLEEELDEDDLEEELDEDEVPLDDDSDALSDEDEDEDEYDDDDVDDDDDADDDA